MARNLEILPHTTHPVRPRIVNVPRHALRAGRAWLRRPPYLPGLILCTALAVAVSCEQQPESTSSPAPTVPPVPETQPAMELSIAVAPIPNDLPKYDRGDWRHWIDEDMDCQDTRQEVLIAEATARVTYTNEEECRVATGSWVGPYTGEEFSDPGMLDVDHMVPLANAHRSGGWEWDDAKKREYANDLSYDGHLIAVRASANRSKGSDGPEEWKPPRREYWCQYATDWIVIKSKWGLTATEMEAAALGEMLDGCTTPRRLQVIRPALQ